MHICSWKVSCIRSGRSKCTTCSGQSWLSPLLLLDGKPDVPIISLIQYILKVTVDLLFSLSFAKEYSYLKDETVLRGGMLSPETTITTDASLIGTRNEENTQEPVKLKRRRTETTTSHSYLHLSLSSGCPLKKTSDPTMYLEEESTMTSLDSECGGGGYTTAYTYSRVSSPEKKVLNLFV